MKYIAVITVSRKSFDEYSRRNFKIGTLYIFIDSIERTRGREFNEYIELFPYCENSSELINYVKQRIR